ncbi:MAG TPA: thioredoxin family protein [Polyangia bacterium]|nr:thioredoxin family protein [Polyangia bacterium]
MSERRAGGGVMVAAVVCAAFVAGALAIARRHRAASPAPPGWNEGAAGLAAAERESGATRAPMLVYFHTEWCGYCKRLERDLLPAPAVERALAGAVKVRLDPERSPDERAIADRYGVRGYPSLFLERAGRRVRLRPFTPSAGGWKQLTPAEFAAQLDSAANP